MNSDQISKYATDMSKIVHQDNVEMGWWDDEDRCIYSCFQLVSTELAEATEGFRKNLMDDKLPHRVMEEVELADAFIRILDLVGHLGIEFCDTVYANDIHPWLEQGVCTPAKMHLALNSCLLRIVDAYETYETWRRVLHLSILECEFEYFILSIFKVAELRGFDLVGATVDKIQFNRTRQDHTREARAQKHGKKI